MLKKFIALAIVCSLFAMPAAADCGNCGSDHGDHAGHDHDGHDHAKKMSKEDMQAAMMKEMAGCQVCSVMLPHMNTTCAAMEMEIVTLDDGMAIIHSVPNDAVADFHTLGEKMHQAGDKVMGMDEKAAADALCGNCEKWHGLMKAGANYSRGTTSTGDIMVFTSEDPKVQKMIAGVEAEWRAMMTEWEG